MWIVAVAQPHGRFERGVVVIIKDEKGIRTRGNLVLQKNAFQGERIVRAAVSYTHLTLPTKLEV